MTSESRGAQEVLADHFRLTADLCNLTGEYHRLLQKVAAAGFARQLAEDGPDPDLPDSDLVEAERIELGARLAADNCELRIHDLEQQLGALARELAALR